MKVNELYNRQLCIFKLKSTGDKPDIKLRIKTEKIFGIEDEHSILCKNCRSTITLQGNIISVDGEHTHIFTNPAGITFEIACFSSADGCIISADSTLEDTWFEGFNWSSSHCSACLIHLGWFYQSAHESFFGLILDHLTYNSQKH